MFFKPHADKSQDFSNKVLILPCVSVGNVGQLAVDLIISTLLHHSEAVNVGRVVTNSLRPVVGPNPYRLGAELMTAAEVYLSEARGIALLQIRSPCFRETRDEFIEQLVNWIKESRFERVIVLSSTYSQFLADNSAEEGMDPVRQLATKKWQKPVDTIKPIEPVERFSMRPTDVSEGGQIYLPGSGLTRRLFNAFEAAEIASLFLIKYCSEGENTSDALRMVNVVNGVIQIRPDTPKAINWERPFSWRQLFGGDAPSGVY